MAEGVGIGNGNPDRRGRPRPLSSPFLFFSSFYNESSICFTAKEHEILTQICLAIPLLHILPGRWLWNLFPSVLPLQRISAVTNQLITGDYWEKVVRWFRDSWNKYPHKCANTAIASIQQRFLTPCSVGSRFLPVQQLKQWGRSMSKRFLDASVVNLFANNSYPQRTG